MTQVGPTMDNEELVRLLNVVNPDKELGRVTLITRYSANKIENHLAGHTEAVKNSEHPVVWVCDPVHGKYVVLLPRRQSFGIEEITACLRIHTECNSRMGGISLEFTGRFPPIPRTTPVDVLARRVERGGVQCDRVRWREYADE